MIRIAPVQPDELPAVAASYDASLRHGTQTPFNDTLTYLWEGGHWQADATHDSIITAGNGGEKTIQARFTLYYDQGKQHYDLEQELKPHQQMWIDVGKLIRNRVPDKSGALLPPGLTMGAYAFRDLTDPVVGNLFEAKVILDKTFGQVAYGCSGCCAYQGNPDMYYDPINVVVGSKGYQDVWDFDDCTHEYVSVLGSFLTGWGTDDSAIATASAAVVTGVGAGQTTVYASGLEGVTGGNRCLPVWRFPSGEVGVGPVTTTTSSVTQIDITPWVPQLETGIGGVAAMLVGPTSSNWNGWQLNEAVTQGTNTCPASWPNICTQSGKPFTVGAGGQAVVTINGVETPVGPVFPPVENIFYDQHTVVASTSGLDVSHINSCHEACTQTYSWAGIAVGQHTINYDFSKEVVKSTNVTITGVSKQ